MTATLILAVIGIVLCVLSLVPQLDVRLATLGAICIGIAVLLAGR